jgi:chorismate synthase
MTRLRFLTAGESHGRCLTAVLEGCPAGLAVSAARIDEDLRRRQGGYGRGARQAIESDQAEIVAGVRYGRTTGAPIALTVANRDAGNWADVLAVEAPADASGVAEPVTVPRPGHADLGGALLYDLDDIRDVIERASARETAARVACGAIAKLLLEVVGCRVVSHVVAVGSERAAAAPLLLGDVARVEADPLRCVDAAASARMRAAVDAAREAGDTLGGVVEVLAFGYPPGVGTYAAGDRRLEAALAAAVFTVPAIKGVEFGLGFAAAGLPGSKVHDALGHDAQRGYVRRTGNAGGVEGGISTGDTVVLRAAMKPIATLREPLQSVEMGTHRPVDSRFERSDVCAVPAAGVVLEAVIALALADAALERFGGATVTEFQTAVDAFRAYCLTR